MPNFRHADTDLATIEADLHAMQHGLLPLTLRRTAVSDANVVKLLQPGSFADPLTEVLRNGARALLAQAIETEVVEFLAKHVDLKSAPGLRRVVRHGRLPNARG